MRATLIVSLIAALTALSPLWGHQSSPTHGGGEAAPVGTTSLYQGALNRMGYGYIGPSEAATDGIMRFSCAEADVARTVGEICNRTGSLTPESISTFIRNSATPAVIEGIRAKIYEEHFLKRYAMQQFPDAGVETEAALNGAPPPATPEARLGYTNHCMHWNQEYRRGQARHLQLRRVNGGMPNDEEVERMPAADKTRIYKAKAMTNHWSNANLTKAVVLYDYFKSAKERACAPRSSVAEACDDLKKKMSDVETSYPIFGSQYADEVSDIRSQIHKLYGVEAMRTNDDVKAESSGKKQYEKDVNRTNANFWNTKGYPNVVDKIESVIRRQSELKAPQNAMALRYATGLRDSAQLLKQKMYDWDNTQYWNDACGMGLSQLIEKYPNAVRQYLVDASPAARRLGQVALCKQSNFTPLPDKNCQGVSKETDGTIRVNSHTISYPYGSDRRYKIRPTGDSAAPYEISMNMRFKINPELYTPPPRADRQREIDDKITAWKEAAQGFYECQYGSRATYNGKSCPPSGALPAGTPKVKFKFNFVSPGTANADTATIDLHKCFNGDAPEGQRNTCRGVERFNRGRVDEDSLTECANGKGVALWYQPDVVTIRNRLTADQRTRLCSNRATDDTPTAPPADVMTTAEINRLARLRYGSLSAASANFEDLLNSQPGELILTASEKDRRAALARRSSTNYAIPAIGTTVARNNSYWVDNDAQLSADLQLRMVDFYARIICLPTPTDSSFLAQARNTCRQVFGRPSSSSTNRQNAGNYTLDQDNGTVFHEVGHIFGLDDEYLDPTYPYTPQGEHDSIMNNSDEGSGRLHSRHLQDLLSPLKCPVAQ
ncbi:MAG: hypothetical protein A2X86_21630 [Bdellovibrionales bacterium GWA2_49_15]|nr:MAG: hypothetical protein A2X86_21630 [Bdellovibrionales bacterium GWA2_49_15]HAZ11568.1 hypothetical protein [Bdellovibrionales bacterium]